MDNLDLYILTEDEAFLLEDMHTFMISAHMGNLSKIAASGGNVGEHVAAIHRRIDAAKAATPKSDVRKHAELDEHKRKLREFEDSRGHSYLPRHGDHQQSYAHA
jgi:hypothetical protein